MQVGKQFKAGQPQQRTVRVFIEQPVELPECRPVFPLPDHSLNRGDQRRGFLQQPPGTEQEIDYAVGDAGQEEPTEDGGGQNAEYRHADRHIKGDRSCGGKGGGLSAGKPYERADPQIAQEQDQQYSDNFDKPVFLH